MSIHHAMVDDLVRSIEKQMALDAFNCHYYESSAMRRRLAQAIVYQILDPFLHQRQKEISAQEAHNEQSLPGLLRCGGLRIDTVSGKVSPEFRLLVSSLMKFCAMWTIVAGAIFRFSGRSKARANAGAAVLIYGAPHADSSGNSRQFEEFCVRGPIVTLSQAKLRVIETHSEIRSDNPESFVYSKNPLLELFKVANFSARENLSFILQHLLLFPRFLAMIVRNPIVCLLWRDFSHQAPAMVLNNNNRLTTCIITNSTWLVQPLWMTNLSGRNFETVMALYSLNTQAMASRSDPYPVEHPALRHLRVDEVWVWDEDYSEVLDYLGVSCRTKVVGPLLWYLPPANLDRGKSTKLKLCLFDVTPMSVEWLVSRGVDSIYYSPDVMTKLLDDVLAARARVETDLEVEIEVFIKQKRKPSEAHDKRYLEYVARIARDVANVSLVPEDTNLYALLDAARFAIVVPYSSVASVAKHLGVPVVFYDPVNELLGPCGWDPSIELISSIDELEREMKDCLESCVVENYRSA